MLAAELREAIAAGDGPRALPLALAAWRDARSVELAELIDRLTSGCTLPTPPHTLGLLQRWWMAHATAPDPVAPDPVAVGALVATWSKRMHVNDVAWEAIRARWTIPNAVIDGVAAIPPPRYLVEWARRRGEELVWRRNVPNWVERAAAMVAWADDPRCARPLAVLLCDPAAYLEGEVGDGPWPAIIAKLRALRDPRVGEVLARVDERNLSAVRQHGVRELRAQLPAERAPPASSAGKLEPLWREVGEHPEDDAPRLVLADALLAAGDNRGELLALQCAPELARKPHAEVEARRLLKREWDRWFGDLTRLLARRGTEVRRGMLERIRVGINDTPAWVWEAAAGHHELVAVREVRPAMAPPTQFASLVAGLPRFPRLLQIDAHEVIELLLATHEGSALEHVHYEPTSKLVHYGRVRPPVEAAFEMLARLAPNLRRLDLGDLWWHGGTFRRPSDRPVRFGELVHRIRALFPSLVQLRIATSRVPAIEAELATISGIEVVDGFSP